MPPTLRLHFRRCLSNGRGGKIFVCHRAGAIALFEACAENQEALITAIEGREVSRQRPVPLSAYSITRYLQRQEAERSSILTSVTPPAATSRLSARRAEEDEPRNNLASNTAAGSGLLHENLCGRHSTLGRSFTKVFQSFDKIRMPAAKVPFPRSRLPPA